MVAEIVNTTWREGLRLRAQKRAAQAVNNESRMREKSAEREFLRSCCFVVPFFLLTQWTWREQAVVFIGHMPLHNDLWCRPFADLYCWACIMWLGQAWPFRGERKHPPLTLFPFIRRSFTPRATRYISFQHPPLSISPTNRKHDSVYKFLTTYPCKYLYLIISPIHWHFKVLL